MNKTFSSRLIKIFIGSIVIFTSAYPLNAEEFLFDTTPEGIKNYINQINLRLDNGSVIEIIEARNCKISTLNAKHYDCNSVDYNQYNNLGVRTCINRRLSASSTTAIMKNRFYFSEPAYGESTCGPYRYI
jgi:hypothetical protein